jgi:hypothetical protein
MKTSRSSSYLVLLVCSLVCVLLSSSSQAAVIIGNMPQTADNNSLIISNDAGGYLAGMVFTMGSQDYSVDSVILRLGSYVTPTDTARIGFFLDNGSGTNTGAQVGSFLISPSSASSTTSNFTFLPDGPLVLQASTKYWLLADSTSSNYLWWGNNVNPSGAGATFNAPILHSTNDGVSYTSTNFRPTFQINGTAIPEPSRALLLVLGLGTMIVRRRRA